MNILKKCEDSTSKNPVSKIEEMPLAENMLGCFFFFYYSYAAILVSFIGFLFNVTLEASCKIMFAQLRDPESSSP